MNLNAAIDKLEKFQKIAKSFKGKCDLVDMNEESFTIKVIFKKDSKKTPIGFSCE